VTQSVVAFGFEKLNTYYNTVILKPDVSYYTVATALHPKLCMNWFKTQWKNFLTWHKKAESSIRRTFKAYVDDVEEESQQSQQPLPPLRRKLPSTNTSTNLYERTTEVDLYLLTNAKNKRQKRVNQLDEYFDALYFDITNASEDELQLILEDNPWAWWNEYGRSGYPILFKIATDYLSIPATSCECERAFSKAKRTISDNRNNLSAATIEAIQLQKNWVQRGVVNSPLKELAVYVENVDKKRVVPVANLNASQSINTSFNSQPGKIFELLGQSEDNY
jgi:hypothetical protein